MTFGNRLKEFRNLKNLDISQFALELNIPESDINLYEASEKEPDLKFFVNIYEKFNVDLEWLITGSRETMNKLKSLEDFKFIPIKTHTELIKIAKSNNANLISITSLWNSCDEEKWTNALSSYYSRVKDENYNIEIELEEKLCVVRKPNDLDKLELGNSWYDFLLNKYFKWKYTAPNRYATTTAAFKKAYQNDNAKIDEIISRILFVSDKEESFTMIKLASEIKGLGVAGASGLLSLLFPEIYGTVDQFLVINLQNISSLNKIVQDINPIAIKNRDFVELTAILREKTIELNNAFKTDFWTPRKIDKVLWTIRS